MKKLFLAVSLALVGCTNSGGESIVPVGTMAQKAEKVTLADHSYAWEEQEIDGMKYRVYFKKHITSQTGYTVFAINLTKDKLEVQALEEKLKEKN